MPQNHPKVSTVQATILLGNVCDKIGAKSIYWEIFKIVLSVYVEESYSLLFI